MATPTTNDKQNEVQVLQIESVFPEKTGKIDLHLKSPEDVQLTIKKELQKFGEGFEVALLEPKHKKQDPAKQLALLKKKLSGYEIKDENDAEGYEKMDTARKMLVKLRTGIAAKHKTLKDNYLAVSRALDNKKNELTDLVVEMETTFKTRLAEIDQIKKDKEEAKARELQETINKRVAELKEAGIKFDGSFYVIGEHISLDIATIGDLKETIYQGLLSKVKELGDDERLKEKKDAQRQRVEKYLMERRQRAQDVEAKRLKDEADNLKKTRAGMRKEFLIMLGFEDRKTHLLFSKKTGTVTVQVSEMEEMDAAAWDPHFKEIREAVKNIEETEKDNARKIERLRLMSSIGYTFDDQHQQFFIKTEVGEGCYFSAGRVFEDQPDFEQWFNNVAKVDAEKMFKEAADHKEQQETLKKRTNARVAEVINGFGLVKHDNLFIKPSKFLEEPEMSGVAVIVKEESIINYDEANWKTLIEYVSNDVVKFQKAEAAVKERKDKEAEDLRVALLNETDRVNEYLLKVDGIVAPEVEDKGLKQIILNLRLEIETGRMRLDVIKSQK